MRRIRTEQPALITSAPVSNDDEFDRRRRRYAVMMTLRALCVLGAALTYHLSAILAIAFVIAGAVLPWCAVLIANDRPPKKRTRRPAYGTGSPERALPGQSERTIEG
jgi:Flp pilus assembly protein TadB